MAGYQWCGNGCPPSDRLALCKAFIAKAVWDFSTTSDLIDAIRHRPVLRRLCGWETLGEVPSESTFSRAFGQFSSDNRPQAIHEALIKTHYGEKIAGHISRDATAIHAREKATAKPQEKTGSKPGAESKGGKRGRRRKEPKRLQQQLERVNSHLHEQHGGRHVHVRGPIKVAAHLAFGLVVIAAEQMLKMLG